MAMAMTFIGAATTAWALMWLITALDAPGKKNEPQSSGNYSRARCGR